ncbi:MAG: hypothetical protein AAFO91_17135, partial [Bacteroidota bacterium]
MAGRLPEIATIRYAHHQTFEIAPRRRTPHFSDDPLPRGGVDGGGGEEREGEGTKGEAFGAAEVDRT